MEQVANKQRYNNNQKKLQQQKNNLHNIPCSYVAFVYNNNNNNNKKLHTKYSIITKNNSTKFISDVKQKFYIKIRME